MKTQRETERDEATVFEFKRRLRETGIRGRLNLVVVLVEANGWPAIVISIVSFLLIVWLKRDVALVVVAAMVGGLLYALARALL